MEQSPVLKNFIKYASLNVMGMIGISCYILADTFFISLGLGANGLAALNLAIPIYSFIHGCGLMLGMGGATKYTIAKSQGKDSHCNTIFTNTMYLAALFALFFFLCGLLFSRQITTLLQADQEIYAMTNIYLKMILLFAPAFIANEVLLSFVRNDGAPALSMTAMVCGSLFNIVFDYIFIFPMDMGIFGAVLATVFSPICSMLILSSYRIRKRNRFHFTRIRPQISLAASLLSLGFPSLVTEVSSGIVMIVFNMIILHLSGNIGIAAYGVIANLILVVMAIFTGIAQGTQPLLSHAYGLQNLTDIRRLLRYALIAVVLVSSVIYTAVYFYADPVTALFNSEQNATLQHIASKGLKLYFTGIGCAGVNIILAVFFTSTDRPLPAHIISLLRGLALIIPLAFLLSSLWGITGVWLAFPVTELCVTAVGILLYLAARRHADGSSGL